MRQKAVSTRGGQRGVVLIWVAMFLIIVMAFMSLGIDLAKLMTTRTQLQNAADAAALAGASGISFTTGELVPDSVVARAQMAASQNKAFIGNPEPVVVASGDVTIIDGDKVKVTARREGSESMITHVAQVLGITALQMRATATAKVEPAGSILCGIVPLGVSPPPGEDFQPGCTPGYTLKFEAGEGENGNYGALSFPECDTGDCAGMAATGANTFRCLVAKGYCCSVEIGDQVYTEPGNISSMRKAVLDRFKADTDQRQDICFSEYMGTGNRIIIVPVVTPPGNGRTLVTVESFAAFFIKNIPGTGTLGSLDGEFVFYIAAATGGGDPDAPVVAFAIRLVD